MARAMKAVEVGDITWSFTTLSAPFSRPKRIIVSTKLPPLPLAPRTPKSEATRKTVTSVAGEPAQGLAEELGEPVDVDRGRGVGLEKRGPPQGVAAEDVVGRDVQEARAARGAGLGHRRRRVGVDVHGEAGVAPRPRRSCGRRWR